MSSPDVQDAGHAKPPPAESSSFLRWLITAGLIVVLAVAAVFAVRMLPTEDPRNEDSLAYPIPSKPKGPPGKIVLAEDPTYRFDVMAQKEKGSHTWAFKNGGEGPLELRKGPSTCSCTIANFKNDTDVFVLEPGKSTDITLTWETRDFEGDYKKSATINVFGDLDKSQVVFAVEGSVRPAVAVMPKERVLSFGDVPSDLSGKSKFAIASADYPDLKLLSLTSSRPDVLALAAKPLPKEDREALEWNAMKGGYLVEVELKPSKDLGAFSEEILVTTDHPKVKEIRLTAGGRRSGPISVIPEAARMHNVSPEEGASLNVMVLVRNAPDTKFEVLGKPDNLKVEITPADVRVGSAAKVRQYRMTITVPPGTPSGEIGGTITLKSDHPQADQVKIPVDIKVLGGY